MLPVQRLQRRYRSGRSQKPSERQQCEGERSYTCKRTHAYTHKCAITRVQADLCGGKKIVIAKARFVQPRVDKIARGSIDRGEKRRALNEEGKREREREREEERAREMSQVLSYTRTCRLETAQRNYHGWMLGCGYEGKIEWPTLSFCNFIVVIVISMHCYRGTAPVT